MKDIASFLQENVALYAGIIQLYKRGTVRILEHFMINKMLTDGLIPYCQFQTDNTASRALQEKLGLRILPDKIAWLF